MALEDAVREKKLELRRAADEEYNEIWRRGDVDSSIELEQDMAVFYMLIQIRQCLAAMLAGQPAALPDLPEELRTRMLLSRTVWQKLNGKLQQINALRDAGDEAGIRAITW